MVIRTDGPFITGAFFVERVLTEQDATNSYIRVIDRTIIRAVASPGERTMPTLNLDLLLVVLVRAGAARGRHDLIVRPEKPSGEQMAEHVVPVTFDPSAEAGLNLHMRLQFGVDQEGTYWFDILWGDARQLLTRTPLRVVYQP